MLANPTPAPRLSTNHRYHWTVDAQTLRNKTLHYFPNGKIRNTDLIVLELVKEHHLQGVAYQICRRQVAMAMTREIAGGSDLFLIFDNSGLGQ